MGRQHFLVLLGAIRLHFVTQNFLEVFEEFVVDLACSVAFLAWKPVLVDHLAIALVALWEVLKVSGNFLTN